MQLQAAKVLKHTKLTPLASEILERILRRIILITPVGGSKSIRIYKTGKYYAEYYTEY